MKSLSKKVVDIKPSEINEFFNLLLEDPSAISLCVGQPNFSTPKHIEDVAIKSISDGKNFYTSDYGILELREEIAKYLNNNFSTQYLPSEVLVTVGASEAIDLAIRVLVNEGDEIIVFDPVYDAYTPLIRIAGGKDIHVELREEDGYKINPRLLEEKITDKTKAIIMNFPNNPTGAIMTREDLEEVANIVKKHDLYLISDEIYAELTYDTKHTSIVSLDDMKERTILINGFSKAYAMTGFRLGYLCANEEIIAQTKKLHAFSIVSCPSSSQFAGIEALKNGRKDIDYMVSDYNKRRIYAYNRLLEMNIPVHKPEGAFYLFPSIKEFGLTAFEFAKRLLEEKHVALIPGSAFGSNYKYNLRISYTCSYEDLKEGLDRLNEFINELRK